MKISKNWISDYIHIPSNITAQELAETITLSVCEVEGFEHIGNHHNSIVCVEVVGISPHPNANKLSIVTVQTKDKKENVVCGANNFKVGDKVAYAGIGTQFKDFTLKKASIRGVESCGMLCADDELELSDSHDGLHILPSNTQIGTSLSEIYPDHQDIIFEIDNKSITNRPDLWGHYGFARELSAIYQTELKPLIQTVSLPVSKESSPISVTVKSKHVPRFSGLVISNLQVVPSPSWISHRLYRVGMRAINNLVDVTNYIMLDMGQPMHSFDADAIPGNQLIVREAEQGERLMTLYNKEVELDSQDVVICDGEGPTALAGIIGGLRSGIQNTTTSIFLEAANWNPVMVRKTSTKIGIRTDACQRYEKSLDPNLTEYAIVKAFQMLQFTCPKQYPTGNLLDIQNHKFTSTIIQITPQRICDLLGISIPNTKIKDILERLGFSVELSKNEISKNDSWKVTVPSWRATKDISIPEDLVEEIGRIYGFNQIEPKAPLFPIQKPLFNEQRRFERKTKQILSQNGFHEVYNYPLTCFETEGILGENTPLDEIMKLINPVAENQNQMRTSMLPHFLKMTQENQKVSSDFQMYEIGRIYHKKQNSNLKGYPVQEKEQLILMISNETSDFGNTFYTLKSQLENVLSQLQLSNIQWNSIKDLKKYQHPYISAQIYTDQNKIGEIFALTPEFRDQLHLKGSTCFAIFDFDAMFEIEKQEYYFKPMSKFPPVLFDISLRLPKQMYFGEIKANILNIDPLIQDVEFSDLFYPENETFKSMTVSIMFQSQEKTFTPEETIELQDKIVDHLSKIGYPLR